LESERIDRLDFRIGGSAGFEILLHCRQQERRPLKLVEVDPGFFNAAPSELSFRTVIMDAVGVLVVGDFNFG
jgi:hypothetical protein